MKRIIQKSLFLFVVFYSVMIIAQDKVPLNTKYSYGDFSGQVFTEAKEFNNTIIVGSAFGVQGEPYSEVFPADMTGVIFRRCNLDNAVIPKGNTVEADCTNKHIKVQNDAEDWIVDKDLNPVSPLHPDRKERWSLSTAPKDIPAEKVSEPEYIELEKQRNEQIIDYIDSERKRLEEDINAEIPAISR